MIRKRRRNWTNKQTLLTRQHEGIEYAKTNNKQYRKRRRVFFASILSAQDFITTITLGRAEAYDIIAINPTTKKTLKIQVKATFSGNKSWMLVEKNESMIEEDLFYAFVRLNENNKPFDFWLIPSKKVAEYISKSHNNWLETPGKQGQKHNPTKQRKFSVIKEKYAPESFNEEEYEKFYDSIEILFD